MVWQKTFAISCRAKRCACPPSAGYRFSKFARRNRPIPASIAAVLAALMVGLLATTEALIRARAAEARAEDELRPRTTENLRLQLATRVQHFQAGKRLEFDDATTQLLDRVAGRVSQADDSDSRQKHLWHFWSPHDGGSFFAFADGHVGFVSYSIDRGTFRALGTYQGGEVVDGL